MGITHVNSVDIQDYMDKYMELGNQGATSMGENVRYIHTYIHTRAVVTITVGLAQAHPN